MNRPKDARLRVFYASASVLVNRNLCFFYTYIHIFFIFLSWILVFFMKKSLKWEFHLLNLKKKPCQAGLHVSSFHKYINTNIYILLHVQMYLPPSSRQFVWHITLLRFKIHVALYCFYCIWAQLSLGIIRSLQHFQSCKKKGKKSEKRGESSECQDLFPLLSFVSMLLLQLGVSTGLICEEDKRHFCCYFCCCVNESIVLQVQMLTCVHATGCCCCVADIRLKCTINKMNQEVAWSFNNL